jgi:hypothetical protein
MQAAHAARQILDVARIGSAQQVRHMAGHATPAEKARLLGMWRNVTFAAMPVLAGLGVYLMLHPHAHHAAPHYPYLKKRDRKFPWGTNCDLFDLHCGSH